MSELLSLPAPKTNKKTKKTVLGVLVLAMLALSSSFLLDPTWYRKELLASIIIMPEHTAITADQSEIDKIVEEKNKKFVKVTINRRKPILVTLYQMGYEYVVPKKKETQLSFFGGLLVDEDEPVTAQLILDHDRFDGFVEGIKTNIEKPAEPSEIAWNEEVGWAFDPAESGIKLNDDVTEESLKTLSNDVAHEKGELSFILETERTFVHEREEERTTLEKKYQTMREMLNPPVQFKVSGVLHQLDLNQEEDFILIKDELEINMEKVLEWLKRLEDLYFEDSGTVTITDRTEIRKGVYKAVTEGDFAFGKKLDGEELYQQFLEALKKPDRMITTVFHDVPFHVYSNLENTAYDLLSTGYSDYSTGNHADRVHNFSTVLKRVSGILIDRGEPISLISAIGKIDDEFVEGLGIFGSVAQPVLGGGICQAATTYFRALLNLGVPILQRKNHSWDLSYYRKGGYGLDATVFPAQKLDVKGVNDLDSQLYFYSYVDAKTTSAYVLVYGKSDGRKITLIPGQDFKPYPGPKTLKWKQIVELPTGEVREYDIISTYKK